MPEYAINPYSKNPIFQINDHIGYDEEDGQGIDGNQFSKEFFEVDNLQPETITTHVNTMGGDVKEAIEMFNAIANSKSETIVDIHGFGYSCGSWVGSGADKVRVNTGARIMMHMPYNPDDPEDNSEFLKGVCDTITTKMSETSGKHGVAKKTKEEVLELLKNKTFLSGKEFYDMGFADELVDSYGIKAENKEGTKAVYKKYQIALNKFVEENIKTTSMSFPKIVNKFKELGINISNDSTEDGIFDALVRYENKFHALNDEKGVLALKTFNAEKSLEELRESAKKLQNDMDAAVDNYAKTKKSLDDMEADCVNLRKEVAENKAKNDEIEMAAKKEKAENFIKELQATGKIKTEDQVNYWKEKAINNFKDVEMQFDLKPANKAFQKVDFKKPVAANEAKNYAEMFRAKNREKLNKQKAVNVI